MNKTDLEVVKRFATDCCNGLGIAVPKIELDIGKVVVIHSDNEKLADILAQDLGRRGYNYDVWLHEDEVDDGVNETVIRVDHK